jgi:hypothetical protein
VGISCEGRGEQTLALLNIVMRNWLLSLIFIIFFFLISGCIYVFMHHRFIAGKELKLNSFSFSNQGQCFHAF